MTRRLLFVAAMVWGQPVVLAAQSAVSQPAALRFQANRQGRVDGQSRTPATPIHSTAFVVDSTDRWFARDKARHFGTSAAIQLMGYGILRIAGMSRVRSGLAASLVTASAGVGKELWDRQGHGDASARDLVWDGLGLLAGSGLAKIGDPP